MRTIKDVDSHLSVSVYPFTFREFCCSRGKVGIPRPGVLWPRMEAGITRGSVAIVQHCRAGGIPWRLLLGLGRKRNVCSSCVPPCE